MPLYEYECRSCGQQFEALVRTGSPAACPACQGDQLDRLLSSFAVSSDGTRTLALKDGKQRRARIRQESDHAEAAREKAHEHDHD